MDTQLPLFPFPTEKIKIDSVMKQEKHLQKIKSESPDPETPGKVKDVYGELYFPPAPVDRPYTFGSLVESSDGKIAFPNKPEGPLVAGKNFLDPWGGKADFWVLNMLRAYADCAIIGAKTLQAEPKGTSHVFCEELAEARVKELGKKGISPWNCIVSFDGTDIPLQHAIFGYEEITVLIGTGPAGAEYLKKEMGDRVTVIGPFADADAVSDDDAIQAQWDAAAGKVVVFATGKGTNPDAAALLKCLRFLGVERAIIESPSYLWHLIGFGGMDEIFLNYSSVFVGGKIVLGGFSDFTTEAHPHGRFLQLGTHGEGFLFTRQQFVYGLTGSNTGSAS
jgi:riboflavin biosynthesis pyrimidine reductase